MDGHNKPAYLISQIVDITDLKQSGAEKEKLQAQLIQAKKMESVGRLAGGVAHDFNNILSVIIGNTELAMLTAPPNSPFSKYLREILYAANHSADITRQLLGFARKQSIAPEVLDLNETIKGTHELLRRLIGEGIDLIWKPGSKVWPIKVDPYQIDQILANLCINAQDAIADVGKIIVETDIVFFDEAYCADHIGFIPGDYTLLAVSDNGCGMSQQTLENLFEPFFTTKDKDKGTGLGLATVYGIVKQNNGYINVYSDLGHGTTFKIYLPRHEAPLNKNRKIYPVEPDLRGSETILLVEDEPTILHTASVMLERFGYTVLSASTPDEAISLAHENSDKIQLLVTDVIMPKMNGKDLAMNLLSHYPYLKHLFMSGYTAKKIEHHGVMDKEVNFIQKPFSMKDLGMKIREVLDGTK